MRYLRSNNETIRREYNRLRVLLVEMIRTERESNTGIEQRLSALDALFRDVKKNDRRLIAEVDILVGDQKITPEIPHQFQRCSEAARKESGQGSSQTLWARFRPSICETKTDRSVGICARGAA